MFARLAALFRLTDEAWARHANPWSVWTRAPIIPLVAMAIWSRIWIGGWAAALVVILVAWIFANPRVFPPARPNDGWCWRATMGERILVERDRRALPGGYFIESWLLAGLSAAFALVMAWGLHQFSALVTVLGTFGAVLAKFWFLDRMAWLYDDVTRADAKALENPVRPPYL